MSTVQIGVINYAPKGYALLQDYAQKINAKSFVQKQLNNEKLAETLVAEVTKVLALEPESLAMKMQGMTQCLVDQGMIKSSEMKLVSQVFSAYAQDDIYASAIAIDELMMAGNLSQGMQAIVGNMPNQGNGPNATANSVKKNNKNWDEAIVVLGNIGILAGGIIGFILGGPGGAVAGAGLGATLMKAVGTILKSIFRKRDNVIPGPNGEDCTRPFVIF